jgi:hypothetical protein
MFPRPVDYHLADMQDDELCRRMKMSKLDVQLILISGTHPDQFDDCADFFFLKGEDPQMLLQRSGRCLEPSFGTWIRRVNVP